MKDYTDTCGAAFDLKEEFDSYGQTCINVLSELKGKPWDDIALAYISALRPSRIRVTSGIINLDCHLWRVTVYVDNFNIIERIEQEVRIGIPKEFNSPAALKSALVSGRDSEQTKWHNLDNVKYWMHGIGRTYAVLENGEKVPFPSSKKESKKEIMCIHQEFVRPVDNFFFMYKCNLLNCECIETLDAPQKCEHKKEEYV